MNKLLVISSLLLLTSPVWADDEAGDTHTSHDITSGQSTLSQIGKNGNCGHFHPQNVTDQIEPES